MAKEMIIIFVYDTELLKKEEDDPASAILYFHPHWVSDLQRTALCGQIMGTVRCIKSIFQCPKIVSLQSGKFNIVEYGRYVLAVGTDRNIPNWVLEHRTNILSSLISFYHRDLRATAALYQSNENFSAKLYHMFETYLKILMYGGNMFSNIATIQLPKSANNVFLEAIQILQSFQDINCVLGGVILYHNKVIATQLSSHLTKHLVLTDPYRIKLPAENSSVDFPLPLGVQLLQVYVDTEEYKELIDDATKCRSISQFLIKKDSKMVCAKPNPSKEPIISAMKRDQSLIFTAVPEEDPDHHSPINIENAFIPVKPQNRPKFLNLRSKTTDQRNEDVPENSVVPSAPYRGQTSVCSTPMTDIKKVLHSGALLICTNAEKDESNHKNGKNSQNIMESFKTESVNSILSAVSDKSHTSLHSSSIERLFKITPYINIGNNPHDKKRSFSMWELREKLKKFTKRITMKYYNAGPSNLNRNLATSAENSPTIDNSTKTYRTITDPTFPVFGCDGKLISQSLYESHVNMQMDLVKTELKAQNKSESNTEEWKSVEDFDVCLKDFTANDDVKKPKNSIEMQPLKKAPNETTHKLRKSLSLPLKSLTSSDNTSDQIFSPNRSKYTGGVQLTPLMSKLSLLAMEERSSGFCSRDTTPSERKEYKFATPTRPNFSFLNRTGSDCGSSSQKDKKGLQKCVLFVCGQQDMVVNILIEEAGCSTPEVVNKLWDSCTECLGKLERQLRHCLEVYPGSTSHNTSETYSYLCMDPEWETVQRGGPWGATELGALTHLHRDFISARNLMEIILRDDDSIIYGHNCSSTEVYYHQSAASAVGLPTPADPMGTVPQKAKRRLERDHSIMLL